MGKKLKGIFSWKCRLPPNFPLYFLPLAIVDLWTTRQRSTMGKRKVKKEESDDEDCEYGHAAAATAAKPKRKKRAAPIKAKKEELTDEGLPAVSAEDGAVVKQEGAAVVASMSKVAPAAAAASTTLVNEKRQARFRSSCPKNITERLERVKSQRFYMIGRERNGQEPKESFKVL